MTPCLPLFCVLVADVLMIHNKETMQLFTRRTNPIFLQMKNLLVTNENLRQARNLFLPRLMNGSIAV
jgi:hypothetical protein